MTFETWLLFVVVALGPALSPGPGLLLALSNALRFGTAAVLWSAAANAAGLMVICLAVAFGLSALLAASAALFTALKIVGAVYLVWLGLKILRDRRGFVPPEAAPAGRLRNPRQLTRQALIVSLTNPKAMVLTAALLPPFLDTAKPVLGQAIGLGLTYGALCFTVHIALALVAGRLRPWLASRRGAAVVRRVLASLFIGFGGVLAVSR